MILQDMVRIHAAAPCPGSSAGERPATRGEVGRSNRPPGPKTHQPQKLFIVGRADLPAGMRVAQMFHSARAFARRYPFVESSWFEDSNTVVLLEAPDRPALERIATKAGRCGVTCAEFSEPDLLGEGLTALTLGPDGSRLVSSLPLALRGL